MSHDPLLQPFTLGPVQLKNRIVSTAHEPAYTELGMPKDRYRLYHREKARGGVGLTMTAARPSCPRTPRPPSAMSTSPPTR